MHRQFFKSLLAISQLIVQLFNHISTVANCLSPCCSLSCNSLIILAQLQTAFLPWCSSSLFYSYPAVQISLHSSCTDRSSKLATTDGNCSIIFSIISRILLLSTALSKHYYTCMLQFILAHNQFQCGQDVRSITNPHFLQHRDKLAVLK